MRKHVDCRLLIAAAMVLTMSSCASLEESSKYEFHSSKYYTSLVPHAGNKVYLHMEDDLIKVLAVEKSDTRGEETERPPVAVLSPEGSSDNRESYNFYNRPLILISSACR